MIAPTIYRYRPHITWGMYLIPIFFGLCILLILASLATVFAAPEPPLFVALVLIYFGFLAATVTVAVLLWLLYYRMAGIRIRVVQTDLWYGRRNETSIIPLESIERLEFPSIRYTGGWLKVVTAKETLRITVVLEGIGNLLLELKGAMDRMGLENRYDRQKFFRFYKTAVSSDQSWDRAYLALVIVVLAIIALFVPGIFLMREAKYGSFGLLAWAVASYLLPCAVWLVSEIVLVRRVAKMSDEETFTCPLRDVAYEKRVYRNVSAIAAMIYLVAVVVSLRT